MAFKLLLPQDEDHVCGCVVSCIELDKVVVPREVLRKYDAVDRLLRSDLSFRQLLEDFSGAPIDHRGTA